jgi:hypothetical protein
MNKADFDRIWQEVEEVTNNRKKGSFKRAFWYGGRTEAIKGAGNVFKALPNIVIANMGKGKGMKKVIRNAPKNLLQLVGKLAGDTVSLAFPHAGEVVPVGAVAVGAFFTQVGKSMVTTFTEILTWIITKDAVKATHSAYNTFGGEKSMSPEIEEAIRKQIKRQLKQLEKEDPLLLIDRNLVKMKDANKKVEPAIQELMLVLSRPEALEEEKFKAMEDALRVTTEALYYAEKVDRMVDNFQEALGELESRVDKLQNFILQIRTHLKAYILDSVDIDVN